jgi:hypothetical protein
MEKVPNKVLAKMARVPPVASRRDLQVTKRIPMVKARKVTKRDLVGLVIKKVVADKVKAMVMAEAKENAIVDIPTAQATRSAPVLATAAGMIRSTLTTDGITSQKMNVNTSKTKLRQLSKRL